MESLRKAVIHYISQGDHLYVHLLPRRPAAVSETDHDFYVRYDRETEREIVGFECFDFSRFVPFICDPKTVPQMDLRFEVEGTPLKNASLQEVLTWAYEVYIRRAWEKQRAV